MIDFGKDYVVGEYYTLDKMYNNSSTIKLVIKERIFGIIEDEEGNKWRTMLTRLSPIKNQDDTLRSS